MRALARFSIALVFCIGNVACAETSTSAIAPRELRALPDKPLADRDHFEDAFAWSQAREQPPPRPKSVSLGYIGDAPLEGGATRDGPPPERMQGFRGQGPMQWWDYVNAPTWTPETHLRNGRGRRVEPYIYLTPYVTPPAN